MMQSTYSLRLLVTLATLVVLSELATPRVSAQSYAPHIPVIGPSWVQVTGNPDLGTLTSPNQQAVDFGIWKAADKSWQILECIRNTKELGHTRLFYRWEGKSLTVGNWKPIGIAMHSDATIGEPVGGLQAPSVIRVGKNYYMFYGDWDDICLASSLDGKVFTRILQPNGQTGMFGGDEDTNVRDPEVISIDGKYYCYYAESPNNACADYCRTSTDLKTWSDPVEVAFGGAAGSGRVSAECPFVVKLASDEYYLFRTQNYFGAPQTTVYYSSNPLDFGINHDAGHLVCTLPVAAPEIVDLNGQYYIAALLPNLTGIRIAPLQWTQPTAR